MKDFGDIQDLGCIQITDEILSSVNGGQMDKWAVVVSFWLGGPIAGCFALGYYNATH